MPRYLWNFSNTAQDASAPGALSNSVQLPALVPPNNGNNVGNSTGLFSAAGNIDVVNDFYWTYTKSRQEVPQIILTEKRLKVNSLIAQLLYSFGSANSNATAIIQAASDTNNPLLQWIASAAGTVDNFAQSVSNSITSNSTYSSIVGDENPIIDNSAILAPYKNLYITKNTGWVYNFPYFENYLNSSANIFAQDSNSPVLGVLQNASNAAANIAGILGTLTSPIGERGEFSFQERAKFYNFPTDGEEISFNFPLINTGSNSYDDVIRNWQLLYLLLYQNKPARISKTVVEPPVLYQVEIPGSKFLPFCYISNIEIDYTGSRRQMNITIPVQTSTNYNTSSLTISQNPPQSANVGSSAVSNQTTTLAAIIPDAYSVRITLRSLVCETRNFLYQAITSPPVTSGFVSTTTV